MSTTEDYVLAIVPKIFASIGIPSSLFIISESILDHRNGRGTVIQRALVGMSCVDVLASFGWFLSTWAIPKGSGPLAQGNVASCNFQGFLLQFAVGSPLYNCSLSLYYVLVIKHNWTNEQLVKIERYIHAFIITFIMSTSIAGLPLTMYNRVGAVCWVVGVPQDCDRSTITPSDVPCERGNWAWAFGTFLFYVPLWICVLLCMLAMFVIYLKVRQTFGKLQRYGFSDENGTIIENDKKRFLWTRPSFSTGEAAPSPTECMHDRSSFSTTFTIAAQRQRHMQDQKQASRLNSFAMQAALYSGSFFITWAPSTVWSMAHWFNAGSIYLDLVAATCEPLQGFWNMLIFIRRRPSSQKKILRLFHYVRCCCCIRAQPLEQQTSCTLSTHNQIANNQADASNRVLLGVLDREESVISDQKESVVSDHHYPPGEEEDRKNASLVMSDDD